MRRERIASLLEEEISNIVVHELNDPRVGFITISQVVLSNDLKEAIVYFSSLDKRTENLELLTRAKGYIRSLLAQRIRLRFMPEIEFRIDNSYEYGQHIDNLLEQINKTDKE